MTLASKKNANVHLQNIEKPTTNIYMTEMSLAPGFVRSMAPGFVFSVHRQLNLPTKFQVLDYSRFDGIAHNLEKEVGFYCLKTIESNILYL